jgi:tetratricopeptide (TPR) repeat protein
VAVEIMTYYQAADYDRAASLVPTTMQAIDTAVALTEGDQHRDAVSLQALIHQIASALFSRTGLTDLGWVAADRSINAARQIDDTELVTAGIYRLGQIMLRAGQNEQAYRLADTTLANTGTETETPSAMSLHGALLLTAAIAASRLDDRRESLQLLRQAQAVAEQLGERNDHWTAFGPTNVQLHTTSAAVALNDPNDVITQGERVDPDAFPDQLRGRRSQVYIDMAWAYSRQRNDTAAVLSLMEAERLAPEAVRFDPTARDVIQTSLHRTRKAAVPGLVGLAERAGVTA